MASGLEFGNNSNYSSMAIICDYSATYYKLYVVSRTHEMMEAFPKIQASHLLQQNPEAFSYTTFSANQFLTLTVGQPQLYTGMNLFICGFTHAHPDLDTIAGSGFTLPWFSGVVNAALY